MILCGPILFFLAYFIPLRLRGFRIQGRDRTVGIWGLSFFVGQFVFMLFASLLVGRGDSGTSGAFAECMVGVGTPGLITAWLVARAMNSQFSGALIVIGTVLAVPLCVWTIDSPLLSGIPPLVWNMFVVGAVLVAPADCRNSVDAIDPNRCETCGYDLRGSPPEKCPECGTPMAKAIEIPQIQQPERAV